jgi:hypothetical protein
LEKQRIATTIIRRRRKSGVCVVNSAKESSLAWVKRAVLLKGKCGRLTKEVFVGTGRSN